MKKLGDRLVDNLSPLMLGVLAFFIIIGPRVLYPTNIAWLEGSGDVVRGNSDPAQHYLGWLFFRNSEWSFPIGLNPTYGLELGNAILFTDSNPLLAFLFKPFASLLPEPFQYSGMWLLACFVLQAWFGWKLAALLSESTPIKVFSTGLFVFAPPMMWRSSRPPKPRRSFFHPCCPLSSASSSTGKARIGLDLAFGCNRSCACVSVGYGSTTVAYRPCREGDPEKITD